MAVWCQDGYLAEQGSPFFAGEEFTVADIPLGSETFRWSLLRARLPAAVQAEVLRPTPALDAWQERLRGRAPFVKGVVEPEEEHQAPQPG